MFKNAASRAGKINVNPKNSKALATPNRLGLVKLASTADFLAKSAQDKVLTPLNFSSRPRFKAARSTDQSGIASATHTKITWNTLPINVGGYFNSNSWTPPAGQYYLFGHAWLNGTMAAGAQVTIRIFKNGAEVYLGAPVYSVSANNNIVSVSGLVEANGSDYFDLYVYLVTTSGTGIVKGDINHTQFGGFMV